MGRYYKILSYNEEWIASKLSKDPEYFKQLSKGQDPDILYVGCSDSRVTAEEILGASQGEVFVHRNVGNLVPTCDVNVGSVVEYAVDHLKVQHIIVCGHYLCGGVKAAMTSTSLGGMLNPWLRNIRDVYRIYREELHAIKNEADRFDRLVELNVKEQCINIIKMVSVQKAYRERGIEVLGWVFDVRNGKLIDLKIDFNKEFEDIRDIYIYSTSSNDETGPSI